MENSKSFNNDQFASGQIFKNRPKYGIYAENLGGVRYFIGWGEKAIFNSLQEGIDFINSHHERYINEKGLVVKPIPMCSCCNSEMTYPKGWGRDKRKNLESYYSCLRSDEYIYTENEKKEVQNV